MTESDVDEANVRLKALIALAVTIVIGVAAWFWLARTTQRGLDRLATIDALRAQCEVAWRAAATRSETLRVDAMPLPDTVDPRSAAAMSRCGNLRAEERANANPREMNGKPLPSGLR